MTNGEKIKEIFPNIENRLDAKTGIMIVKWADNTTKFFKTSWWDAEYLEPTTKSDLRVDCISKAYLLDDNKYHTVFNDDTGNFEDVVYREDIEKAPPVTPIRPKGHWIDHSDDGYVECPKCGSATNCNDNINELHFCFSCGADMREVVEE